MFNCNRFVVSWAKHVCNMQAGQTKQLFQKLSKHDGNWRCVMCQTIQLWSAWHRGKKDDSHLTNVLNADLVNRNSNQTSWIVSFASDPLLLPIHPVGCCSHLCLCNSLHHFLSTCWQLQHMTCFAGQSVLFFNDKNVSISPESSVWQSIQLNVTSPNMTMHSQQPRKTWFDEQKSDLMNKREAKNHLVWHWKLELKPLFKQRNALLPVQTQCCQCIWPTCMTSSCACFQRCLFCESPQQCMRMSHLFNKSIMKTAWKSDLIRGSQIRELKIWSVALSQCRVSGPVQLEETRSFGRMFTEQDWNVTWFC